MTARPPGQGGNILANTFRRWADLAEARGQRTLRVPRPDDGKGAEGDFVVTDHEAGHVPMVESGVGIESAAAFKAATGQNVAGSKLAHLTGRLRTAAEAERTSAAALASGHEGAGEPGHCEAVGALRAFESALAWCDAIATGNTPT